jgi:predicted lipid-binding transport protein (Tim44 family)
LDIVFFAIVAGLVLARLYQVLGQKHGAPPPALKDSSALPKANLGETQPNAGEQMEFGEAIAEIAKANALEQKYSDLYSKISQVRQIMPDFDPIVFEKNASAAYEAIIEAFSRGDEKALRPLVNDEVFSAYSSIISGRSKDLASATEIVKLAEPEIRDISINQTNVEIDVYFSATLKDTGQSPRNTQEIWTFERIIGSNSPIWRLIAVETA